jgi:hypothetical protein
MGRLSIQNPNIDEWITIDDVEYHIGKNTAPHSFQTYMWNIYRKTDQKYFIGTLVLNRNTTFISGGRVVKIMVMKIRNPKAVDKCWVSLGLLKDKETLIGVVRGCVRMNQI